MIFLCGFPSSGKTSLGKKVAKRLAWPFIDLDVRVEKACGCSCREYVLKNGIEKFRELEMAALQELQASAQCIIALGGGAVMRDANIETIKKLGLLLYLKVEKEILWGRLRSKKALPSYLDSSNTKQSFENLYALRQPIYEKNADAILSLNCMSEKSIVEKIIEVIHTYGK